MLCPLTLELGKRFYWNCFVHISQELILFLSTDGVEDGASMAARTSCLTAVVSRPSEFVELG